MFLREIIFAVDKICHQQFSFRNLVDALHHFVRFFTVSPNSIALPILQNRKIILLNRKEVRLDLERSKTSYPNF